MLATIVLACITPFAGTSSSSGIGPAVVVDNRSDQVVVLQVSSWIGAGEGEVSRSARYELAPRRRTRLLYGDKQLRATKVRYRLATAAGSTPKDSGKVWMSRSSPSSSVLEIVVDESLLPSRSERRAVVRAAWALVEARAEECLRVAHPTATLTRLEHEGTFGVTQNGQSRPGHFVLTYRFQWISDLFGDSHWTRLDYFFDANGRLYGLSPATDRPGSTSSFMDPFLFSDGLVNWIEDELLNSEAIQEDAALRSALRLALEHNDARGLLMLWLQIEQATTGHG